MQSAKAFALCDSEKQPMRASYHPVRDFSHFAFLLSGDDVDTAQYAKLKSTRRKGAPSRAQYMPAAPSIPRLPNGADGRRSADGV